MRRLPLIAALCSLPLPGLADGMVVGKGWDALGTNTIAAGDQLGLIVFSGHRETLAIQTRMVGSATEFAWVVPTPSLVKSEDACELAAEAFWHLEGLAAPVAKPVRFVNLDRLRWAGKAHEATAAMDMVSAGGDVTVHETAKVGKHTITTLTATESASLVSWLREHDYEVPRAAEPLIADYVDRGWAFTAVRMDRTGLDRLGFVSRPLALTFETDVPIFPLRISSATPSGELADIELHIVAPQTMAVDSHPTADPPLGLLFLSDDPIAAYEARLARVCADRGQAPAFVREYAGDMPRHRAADVYYWYGLELQLKREMGAEEAMDALRRAQGAVVPVRLDMVLTRVRSRMDATGMRWSDVVFRPDPGAVRQRIELRYFPLDAGNALWLATVLTVVAGTSVGIARARGRGEPWAGRLAIGLVLIALASPGVYVTLSFLVRTAHPLGLEPAELVGVPLIGVAAGLGAYVWARRQGLRGWTSSCIAVAAALTAAVAVSILLGFAVSLAIRSP